ncbi:MAG: vitamin B12 dependent-methionine synthase activation domain-containing protein, partial [Actinomycetes bacterium]
PALLEEIRSGALELRNKVEVVDDSPPVTDDSVRSAVATDNPVPEPPFWGVREVAPSLEELFPHLDRHVLFKLHWGGRGKKGEEWRELIEENFQPRLERMWAEQDWITPKALVGYFPAVSEGNEVVVLDPNDHSKELERLVFPRQPNHDRICLADFFRPSDSGEVDVVALQAVTVGDSVSELLAKLEADGEFAEQLYTHGLGVQAAEGTAEWLHQNVRESLGIGEGQGRRYSWGYPACPDQSEHEKVFRLLGAENIGLSLSEAYAVSPEQSTLAIVTHHPQAVYFGMKSGFVPKDPVSDEVIALGERGGALPDADPDAVAAD